MLPGMGFEPTRRETEDLKSSPLDHSGTPALDQQVGKKQSFVDCWETCCVSQVPCRLDNFSEYPGLSMSGTELFSAPCSRTLQTTLQTRPPYSCCQGAPSMHHSRDLRRERWGVKHEPRDGGFGLATALTACPTLLWRVAAACWHWLEVLDVARGCTLLVATHGSRCFTLYSHVHAVLRLHAVPGSQVLEHAAHHRRGPRRC